MTGAFSISGRDLRTLLMLLRPDRQGHVPRSCSLLLRTMCYMARHDGPSSFFDFANPGAGIVRNSTLRCCQCPVTCLNLLHLIWATKHYHKHHTTCTILCCDYTCVLTNA